MDKKRNTKIVSCSVTGLDKANLECIKARDRMGATAVLRVGIEQVLNKKRLEHIQIQQEITIKKLALKLQEQCQKTWILEQNNRKI